jgi:metallo-beta-lactamase family protein
MTDTNKISIHFLGAAGTVTGSKYLIQVDGKQILVDCGLFQGLKKLRLLNWEYLPFDVKTLDVVVLTHGHLDHVGYLPRLTKMGYRGKIMGTAPTLDVASIILKDSAKIQEEDAARANADGFTKHQPAKPLYTVVDAEKAISMFHHIEEGEWIPLFENIEIRFNYNGHIIGATFIELNIHGKLFVFSGDIGRTEDMLMYAPKIPQKADVLFIESTYGNRLHPLENTKVKLKEIVLQTLNRGGTLIIPSFAVERAQTLMYLLWQLREQKAIPHIPMILDSPMGTDTLKVFEKYKEWHKLGDAEFRSMCKAFTLVEDYKETWEVIANKSPKIVIAGSGMISGGRVLTYLQQYINKPETSVLLVGFQGEGTRGRNLLEGASELKIFGKYVPVKAEIFSMQGLSSHADQQELLDWMSILKTAPEKIYIIHGESTAADAFRVKIKETYSWEAIIPELFQIEEVYY